MLFLWAITALAVQTICPAPEQVTPETAHAIYAEAGEVLRNVVPQTPWAQLDRCHHTRAVAATHRWQQAVAASASQPSDAARRQEDRARLDAKATALDWIRAAKSAEEPVPRRAWLLCVSAVGHRDPCGPEPVAPSSPPPTPQ